MGNIEQFGEKKKSRAIENPGGLGLLLVRNEKLRQTVAEIAHELICLKELFGRTEEAQDAMKVKLLAKHLFQKGAGGSDNYVEKARHTYEEANDMPAIDLANRLLQYKTDKISGGSVEAIAYIPFAEAYVRKYGNNPLEITTQPYMQPVSGGVVIDLPLPHTEKGEGGNRLVQLSHRVISAITASSKTFGLTKETAKAFADSYDAELETYKLLVGDDKDAAIREMTNVLKVYEKGNPHKEFTEAQFLAAAVSYCNIHGVKPNLPDRA